MAYLHCPSCERTAWLDSTAAAPPVCRHCDAALTPMPLRFQRMLLGAVRERFDRDARLDSGRPRFLRG